MTAAWRARGRGAAGVPVEMRFIDMFMAALGALLFMAMAFALLLVMAPRDPGTPAQRARAPAAALVVLNDRELPPGAEDTAYGVQLAADGGEPTYTWERGAPWPDSSAGPLRVTPAGRLEAAFFPAPGTHEIGVTVKDREGRRASKVLRLVIRPVNREPSATVPKLRIELQSLPSATIGRPYDLALAAVGGRAPLEWSLVGKLPDGLALRAGHLVGTPMAIAAASFSLRVRDAQIPPDQAERLVAFAVVHGNALGSVWRFFLSALVLVSYLVLKQGVNDWYYSRAREALMKQQDLSLHIDAGGVRVGGSTAAYELFQQLNTSDRRRVRWLRIGHISLGVALVLYLTREPDPFGKTAAATTASARVAPR